MKCLWYAVAHCRYRIVMDSDGMAVDSESGRCRSLSDPGYMSRKSRKFRSDNLVRDTNGSFYLKGACLLHLSSENISHVLRSI